MTREEIEQLYVEEPNCFETEREEQWYKVGLKEGLSVADSHPHWIPVEERLPEVGEKVIFYSPRIDNWLSGALQQDGRWWCEEYGTHFYDVTHWMEIIPPRKEDKE